MSKTIVECDSPIFLTVIFLSFTATNSNGLRCIAQPIRFACVTPPMRYTLLGSARGDAGARIGTLPRKAEPIQVTAKSTLGNRKLS